jgi:hypothetical protein
MRIAHKPTKTLRQEGISRLRLEERFMEIMGNDTFRCVRGTEEFEFVISLE